MTAHPPERLQAILVGVQTPQISAQELESSLDELERLVSTLGYRVIGRLTQKRKSERAALLLGEGKLMELSRWTGGTGKVQSLARHKKTKAELSRELDAEMESNEEDEEDFDVEINAATEENLEPKDMAQVVIVDCELSPSQLRNLESATGATVLDRTGVIISIFDRHARTKAARLQVEMARLKYVAPRLRETGGGEDRQGGGIGAKGAGETSLELDRRRIRDRIKDLKSELTSLGDEHQRRRAQRKKELSVALVGYTNAGKSSLMRAMTGSEVLVADKLFATLDTTVRPIYPETRPKVLMSDTVGFIKKLPHDLVASFKSTLDEALNASLLLFVVDASDSSFRSQLEVTRTVLSEVGADNVPSHLILNKKDLLTPDEQQALRDEFPGALMISTLSSEDLKTLRNQIMTHFEKEMIDEEVFVGYSKKGVIGEIRRLMRVLDENYTEEGVTLRVRTTADKLSYIHKMLNSDIDTDPEP